MFVAPDHRPSLPGLTRTPQDWSAQQKIIGFQRDVFMNATVVSPDPAATQGARLSIGNQLTLSSDTGVVVTLVIQW
jgi:hypothetical protein